MDVHRTGGGVIFSGSYGRLVNTVWHIVQSIEASPQKENCSHA